LGAAAGGLLGGLVGLGVPEERAKIYSDRVSGGDYLVIIDGNEEEMYRAESICKTGVFRSLAFTMHLVWQEALIM
jgi:hypothetical protein